MVPCTTGHVSILLSNTKSPDDLQDPSITWTTQDFCTVSRDPTTLPGAGQATPGTQQLKTLLCLGLSDIRRFIYSGAFQWEELKKDIGKKLKDSGDVSNVVEKTKCIVRHQER
ncbi:Rho-related BTB domain-containing protein 3 [Fukomys damarensis]|uniref:Rho-related BTB domain-containing protein 3 n=1 Tax=Fukomys damarensis TaxID=885580 RepID=A0A091D475_FUKDA|nr:Rho-related BTB domain-containing protein 3 [Fukomys damarensis]